MDDNFPGACGKAAAPLSDRERKLVEACRNWLDPKSRLADSYSKMLNALRAYDPPRKRPECKIPDWADLTEDQRTRLDEMANEDFGMPCGRGPYVLRRVTEALATEEQ